MTAITGALAATRAEDRAELLEWVASRGLLGIVHLNGVREAASTAYRFADILAGVGAHG